MTVRVKRCECCDLPKPSCGKAAEDEERAELKAWRRYLIRHGWFTAQWPGVCERCGTPFAASGTVIRSDGYSSHAGRYVAECCAPPFPPELGTK